MILLPRLLPSSNLLADCIYWANWVGPFHISPIRKIPSLISRDGILNAQRISRYHPRSPAFHPAQWNRLYMVGNRPKRWSGTLGDDNGAYRLGLGTPYLPPSKRGIEATFSQEAQGRVRGGAVAEASSTWPHSLSLAARYYSLSKPFIAIRLHPKVARTFESRQGIVDSADTSHVPIVLLGTNFKNLHVPAA